jgi:cysteine desulfurase
VVCAATEHRAVLAAARQAEAEGSPLRLVPVDGEGRVDPAALAPLLEGAAVAAVAWANNETGTVQPVAELGALCRERGVPFHTDAVQALGKLPVRLGELPVELLALSAHKVGGPRGIGALFVRRGTGLAPLLHGGGQERGMRPGTEDVAGAAAFAVAAELAAAEQEGYARHTAGLRDRLEEVLLRQIPDLRVNGGGAERLPNLLNVSIPGAEAEALLISLDLEGIAVSSGSACSSGAMDPSHVLTAMGLGRELAGPSLRFSVGADTTAAEIERVGRALPRVVARLRELAEAP